MTFQVKGALQNGYANDVWKAHRWFTLGPNSFGAPGTEKAFTQVIEIPDPFSRNSPGYTYDWTDFFGTQIFWRWDISDDWHYDADDPSRVPPFTVYQLDDNTARLE